MTEPASIDPSEVPPHIYDRRSWIAAKLARRGLSQGRLAAALGCSRQTLGQCLIAPKSARIDAGIAEAIGLTPQQLFPERYAADGSRMLRPAEAPRAA